MTLTAPRITAGAVAIAVWFTLSAPAGAQWLKYKQPGIPRTADGKPDMTARAPRMPDGKPDFSGNWMQDPAGEAETAKAVDNVKYQPWADAISKKREEDLGKDSPAIQCLPRGPIGMNPGKVIQTPTMVVILYDDLSYRQIFLDGRPLPEIINPDWMGYSVGHWDGDTLVVETAGFNDRSWLDGNGHPHSEALRVTERFRRPDFGHLEVQRTFVDPQALAQSWTIPGKLKLDPDTEPLEYVCTENERDRQHLVGKASDEKTLTLSTEILSKYVGIYEVKIPEADRIIPFEISLSVDHLVISGGGAPNTPLKAVSETEFSAPFGNLKFVKDDHGVVNQAIFQIVEGDFKGVRKETTASAK